MLKIEHNHHMKFPRLSLALPHQMQLAPVVADDDELSQAIENDPIDHDNTWELVERPDPGKLEAFWTQVVEDVKSDPEWNTFAED
jgi:hypothetical protein